MSTFDYDDGFVFLQRGFLYENKYHSYEHISSIELSDNEIRITILFGNILVYTISDNDTATDIHMTLFSEWNKYLWTNFKCICKKNKK